MSDAPPFPPPTAAQLLTPADVLQEVTRRHAQDRVAWHGVVWSRLGRGDHAWTWWDRVDAPELHPWLAAERGRVVRELGLHAEAERLDLAGFEAATDPVDRAMLGIGLTADAVGQGRVGDAQARLEEVREGLGRLPEGPRGDRQRIRLAWVEAEVAWMTGRDVDVTSLPHREPSGRLVSLLAYQHGTTFHRAKGLLFGGIASDDDWLLQSAAGIAPPVLLWAVLLARADRGVGGQLAEAANAWRQVVPPPGYEDAVAATPVARRLATVRTSD